MSYLHFTYYSAYVIFCRSVSTSAPLECKVLEIKAFNLFFFYFHAAYTLLSVPICPPEYVLSSSVLSQMIGIEDHVA